MKKYGLLLLMLAGKVVLAQSTKDSVKAVVRNLFIAMKSADSLGVATCFADSALLQTITHNEQGYAVVKNEKVSEFAGFIAKQKFNAVDERIEFENIYVDDDLASVWTPYLFYYSGVFRHCGVNSFQLVRINGQWKIQYLIDTRRKEPCKQ